MHNASEEKAPPRSMERNVKRVAKAHERVKPSESMVAAVNNANNLQTVGERHFAELKGLTEHLSRWRQESKAIKDLVLRKDWPSVELSSSNFIRDVRRVESDLLTQKAFKVGKQNADEQPRVIFSIHELWVYFYRAQAREAMGRYREGIEDDTEALTLCYLMDEPMHSITRVGILHHRGQILHDLFLLEDDSNHLNGAIQDIRAEWALLQDGRNECQEPKDDEMAPILRGFMLKLYVHKRLLSMTFIRPLFSVEQKRALEKELELGPFRWGKYKCRLCGDTPEELLLCGGCKSVWLCDKTCQRQAWKGSGCHNKSACTKCKRKDHFILNDVSKASLDESFEKDNVVGITSCQQEPSVLLRDPTTGRYFDALTDRDVYFYPSEAGMAPGLPSTLQWITSMAQQALDEE